jgi:DNA-binding NtrC family response regulator
MEPGAMKTLLIVDDEAKICHLLADFFQRRGFHTSMANSGSEAIERLSASAPDYLLLDVRMPDLSGLEVLRVARALHPELRVIIVSSIGNADIVEEAMGLGAFDYVTKPFTVDDQAWARVFFSPNA